MSHDRSRVGLPTEALRAERADCATRLEEMRRALAADRGNLALKCRMIGPQGRIEALDRDIRARTTGTVTFSI